MACPKGEFPNPVQTDTYPDKCAKRKRCPTGYHKTKKGCVENSTARNNRTKKNKKSKSGLSDDDMKMLEAYYPNGLSDDDKKLLNEYAPDPTPQSRTPESRPTQNVLKRSNRKSTPKRGLSDDDKELLEAYYPNGLSDDDKKLLEEYAPDPTPQSRMPEYRTYTQAEIDEMKPKPVYGPEPPPRSNRKSTPKRSKRKSTPKRGFFARFFGNTPTPSPRYYKE
jgi:hypothetical protein